MSRMAAIFRLVGFLMAGGMIGGMGHGFLHTWG